MTSAPTPTSTSRLAFLDWMRGFAAVIMLQGHVTHSFMGTGLREQSPYILSQFLGGITPAIFLFLTGVTLAFLMDSRTRAGLPPAQRIKAALRRAGYLALLAFLFRVQLWAFSGGQSGWEQIFKVDILNCMALAIVSLTPLAALDTLGRVRWGAALGAGFAFLSPLVSEVNWGGVHPFLSHYFVPDFNFFAFFPWAAFVAFGLSAGSILRLVKADEMQRLMQWAALAGLAMIWFTQVFVNMPYSLYAKSDFWLNSPALIFIKTGILLLLSAAAFLWTRYGARSGWSPLRQLGSTSLLVYWVHTELVYGRWLGQYKEGLTAPQCAVLAGLVIALMVALSALRTRWHAIPFARLSVSKFRERILGWPAEPIPSPAAGD